MGDAPLDEYQPGFAQNFSHANDLRCTVWKDYDIAVSEFCYTQSLQVFESDSLISTLVGEGSNETGVKL